MDAYSRRHNLYDSTIIDCNNEEHFIESLVELGYIKLLDDVKFWEALKFKIKNFHRKYLKDRVKVMKRKHKKRKWMDGFENRKFQNQNTYRE